LIVMLTAVLLTGAAALVGAQQPDVSKVQIKTEAVAPGVWMLQGAGGNIGVSAGNDGVFVIDDQFAPLTPKIRQAVGKLSARPIRLVVNTHWHGDHVGGNANLASAGAMIVAHDNVRRRMSTAQVLPFRGRTIPASPPAALPVMTFRQDTTLHWNGDEVSVVHVAAAHTDGDAVVHFKRANVIHTGDTFVTGYPFIDRDSGGTVDGYIAAQARVLGMMDDRTRLIPGHGPLGDKAQLKASHDRLVIIRDRVARLRAEGKTVEQVKAAGPTREWDAQFGRGFISGDKLVEAVYHTLPR
jgi:glyoxylase-like metal-dependent hydrolase (beta-lactamase superfamily II)